MSPLNVWSLPKDNPLKVLMLTLISRYGEKAFTLSGEWEEDRHAVGLCKRGEPEVFAYVYTYGQGEGCYGAHLEYPDVDDGGMVMQENVPLEQMLELLAAHLELIPE